MHFHRTTGTSQTLSRAIRNVIMVAMLYYTHRHTNRMVVRFLMFHAGLMLCQSLGVQRHVVTLFLNAIKFVLYASTFLPQWYFVTFGNIYERSDALLALLFHSRKFVSSHPFPQLSSPSSFGPHVIFSYPGALTSLKPDI